MVIMFPDSRIKLYSGSRIKSRSGSRRMIGCNTGTGCSRLPVRKKLVNVVKFVTDSSQTGRQEAARKGEAKWIY